MGEWILIAGFVIFGLVVRWAYLKHVTREPQSVRQMFDRLEAEQRAAKAARTERG